MEILEYVLPVPVKFYVTIIAFEKPRPTRTVSLWQHIFVFLTIVGYDLCILLNLKMELNMITPLKPR